MIISSQHEELEHFQTILEKKFRVTADYEVKKHLGITLVRQDDGSVKLQQSKLLDEILNEYGSSIVSAYPSIVTKTQDDSPDINSTPYLRLLGQLMYLTNSRPDIMTAVSYCATKSSHPTVNDFKKLLKIVAYLRQTPDYGLTLYPRGQSDDNQLNLIAFVDAAFMSHDDTNSHTGYTISLGSVQPRSYFYSKSVKQKLVATSSTHAEIRALYDLVINLIFMINLFNEIERPVNLPVTIFEDNQPAIDLVTSTTGKVGKSKHYLMIINFLREQVEQGLIQLKKIATDKNISNVLTKIINAPEFHKSFRDIMGLIQSEKYQH
jgi:hypothetical protein